MKQKRIPCPICQELILPEAKKCRFCGERLDKHQTPSLSIAYAIWTLSMAIFLFSLYFFRRAPLSSVNFWLATFGVIVSVGLISYLILVVRILKSIKTRKGLMFGLATVVTFVFFFWLLFNYSSVEAKLGFPPPETANNSSQVQPTPTPSPSPAPPTNKTGTTKQPTQQATTKQPDMWTVTADGKTSYSRLPADKNMSTSDELWAAINSYRRSHNLPEFVKSDLLCEIAQKRANELKSLGKLDTHEGFSKYAYGQKTYDSMEEILQGGVMPLSGTHLVEWGWDRSITGHQETLQSREMTDGCAAVSGLFAVGIFGAR